MPIPDYQTLMLPVLRLAAEGETRVADASERIADDLGLTLDERDELLPSGRQRLLHNRIYWAKFYMIKAGMIASPARGRFVATKKGKSLLATSPQRIDVALLMRTRVPRLLQKRKRGSRREWQPSHRRRSHSTPDNAGRTDRCRPRVNASSLTR